MRIFPIALRTLFIQFHRINIYWKWILFPRCSVFIWFPLNSMVNTSENTYVTRIWNNLPVHLSGNLLNGLKFLFSHSLWLVPTIFVEVATQGRAHVYCSRHFRKATSYEWPPQPHKLMKATQVGRFSNNV